MQPPPVGIPGKGRAFVMGGIGCLVAFFVVGGACVAVGGSMYFDAGGLVILFLIGATAGLVANWLYQRGRRAGMHQGPPQPPEPPQGPPF